MRIAICKNDKISYHSTAWTNPWADYCKEKNIDFEFVDCYHTDIIDKLCDFDCVLWHFSQYVYEDMLMARHVLYSASKMGLKVFPDFDTAWHFDDKIAETYLLQTISAPIPKSKMFYSLNECKKWLEQPDLSFPVVAKLRGGSGSHNVKLIKNKIDLLRYARRMFGRGMKASPSLLYKTSSNLKSAKNWNMILGRLKRAPEFLRTLHGAKKFPSEKNYVFLQEFIPNDGYDIKVVVVGDKLSFIGRNIRKGDFRASGGGDLFYKVGLVTKDIIDSAFSINDKLGFQCMGYDYVVDNQTGDAKIVEISYGFSHTALMQAGGHFDRNGVWHNEPLDVPKEIIKNLTNYEV